MFEAALHEAIDSAQTRLLDAREDGRGDDEARHAARLLDLIDRARSNDVETAGWVRDDVLAAALATAGDGA